MEADWEGAAKERLGELDWRPLEGQAIAPGAGERESWSVLLIRPRLLTALQRLNPAVPAQYLQQALAEIASPRSNDAMAENHRIHNCLVDGYRLTYIDSDGNEANPTIRLLSQAPDQNDWLAVNQFGHAATGQPLLTDVSRTFCVTTSDICLFGVPS